MLLREDEIDVKAIDWNRVWRSRNAGRTSHGRDERFWDGRASSFAKAASETQYAGRLLEIMKPEKDWTVLDMGCGSGVLAVPLAKSVFSVTAVDLSGEMLAILRERCEDEGIENVTTIRGRWEDDWQELGIGAHDVALASRSMVADDLAASVLKLQAAARKRVYVATIVGDGPYDRRIFEAIGRPLDLGPDYIYNYNMLYGMDILANVAFIDETRNRTYGSPEEAFLGMQWMFFDGLSGEEEEKLRAYIKENLVFRDERWGFSYNKAVRWAVMWWDKS
jgi:SAM-dependent methyltransferase